MFFSNITHIYYDTFKRDKYTLINKFEIRNKEINKYIWNRVRGKKGKKCIKCGENVRWTLDSYIMNMREYMFGIGTILREFFLWHVVFLSSFDMCFDRIKKALISKELKKHKGYMHSRFSPS